MMKKEILYIAIAALLIVAACEPMEKRHELGPVYGETDLSKYMSVKVDGNYVTLVNNAPASISYWITDFGNQSNKDSIVFRIPLANTWTATLTAFCAGGKVTVSKTFDIAQNDEEYYSSPYWNLLTNGTAGKTWVWASDIPGNKVWGNGGHMGSAAPAWWTLTVSDIVGQGASADDEITFNLDKKQNLIVTMPGADKKPGTGSGTFDMDFTKTLTVSDTVYSLGKITFTNWTIPLGFEPNTSGKPLHYVFNILKLTENELVLEFAEPGSKDSPWGGGAWFYMFKRKGYTYPAP
jgi:hypothetical protein